MLSGLVVANRRHEILRMRVYRIPSKVHLLVGGLYINLSTIKTTTSKFNVNFIYLFIYL